MIGKNEYKRESSVQFVTDRVDIFLKKLQNKKQNELTKQNKAYGLSPNWKVICIQVPSMIYSRNWWLMIKKNFDDT